MNHFLNGLSLGMGLLSIGRSWGFFTKPVPTEQEVAALLDVALNAEIFLWDTAPAYFLSEARIGRYLSQLPPKKRSQVLVMTKFGEHVNPTTVDASAVKTYADHSYGALARSFENSLRHLGKIVAVQVHKASLHNIIATDTLKALAAAKKYGVQYVGASVGDVETGLLAIESGHYDFLQFPLSSSQRGLMALIEKADRHKVSVVTNRPFAMGALMQAGNDTESADEAAFSAMLFLKQHVKNGAVLTGTSNVKHLHANIKAFKAALAS